MVNTAQGAVRLDTNTVNQWVFKYVAQADTETGKNLCFEVQRKGNWLTSLQSLHAEAANCPSLS
jgi:hypothetical protein